MLDFFWGGNFLIVFWIFYLMIFIFIFWEYWILVHPLLHNARNKSFLVVSCLCISEINSLLCREDNFFRVKEDIMEVLCSSFVLQSNI